MTTYHLAQLNIGRIRAPLETATMAGFVSRLQDINALADAAPGFVWRLKTEDGDATAIRPYEDDRMLVNLSVWTGLGELRDFVYRSPHADVMRQRRAWFEPRLEYLRQHGDTAHAFTYRHPFAAPESTSPPSPEEYRDECPAT
jgi:hypothetical protein